MSWPTTDDDALRLTLARVSDDLYELVDEWIDRARGPFWEEYQSGKATGFSEAAFDLHMALRRLGIKRPAAL